MFDQVKTKIRELRKVPGRTLTRAAGVVQRQLEHQAYGRHGNAPHDVIVRTAPPRLQVRATHRVIDIAKQRGEPAEWRETVTDVLRAEVRRAVR